MHYHETTNENCRHKVLNKHVKDDFQILFEIIPGNENVFMKKKNTLGFKKTIYQNI